MVEAEPGRDTGAGGEAASASARGEAEAKADDHTVEVAAGKTFSGRARERLWRSACRCRRDFGR